MKRFIYLILLILPFTLLANNTPFFSIYENDQDKNISFKESVLFFEISVNDLATIKKNSINFDLAIGANYSGVGRIIYPLDSSNKLKIDIYEEKLTNINILTPMIQIGFNYRF